MSLEQIEIMVRAEFSSRMLSLADVNSDKLEYHSEQMWRRMKEMLIERGIK